MNWLEGRFRHASDRESGPLQIMYGIDGREDLPEEELAHLEGYMGSAPVRISAHRGVTPGLRTKALDED
jgi:hypothetical protein